VSADCAQLVMLVEDEDDVREVLRECLEMRGYEVVEARNGRVAVEYLARGGAHPCLIVLDLIMPIMDGWEVLETLARNAAWAEIPVVISTSVLDRVPENRPLLPKPVSLADFLRTVEKSCGRATPARDRSA
jgi:CheY-like chemotaxis protein